MLLLDKKTIKIKNVIFQYVKILQILKKQLILIIQPLNSINGICFVGILTIFTPSKPIEK
ncbi:hypothetical protein CER18_08415 [Bartonella tribocorum]|uniref:Uncharacterized protein n=1 Tax=Bartonella tribocorum TaxID=85701 RepID=A0A2N9Y8P6_9HYPH|nr:hypothetical protein CER18_08415 [Bartonella tribocorum]